MSIKDKSPQFAALPSQVAGIVPVGQRNEGGWTAREWLQPGVSLSLAVGGLILTTLQDERKMAKFAQYAMASAEEALDDAGWAPTMQEELEATVDRSVIRPAYSMLIFA